MKILASYLPEFCALCGKDSESGVHICDRHLDMSSWRIVAEHPFRFFAIGFLHGIGNAPGDDE